MAIAIYIMQIIPRNMSLSARCCYDNSKKSNMKNNNKINKKSFFWYTIFTKNTKNYNIQCGNLAINVVYKPNIFLKRVFYPIGRCR